MTRLTKDIRETLERALLQHRFKGELERLEARAEDFAHRVYRDAYDEEERERMQALPSGWLPEVDTIMANFAGSTRNLRMNGLMINNRTRCMLKVRPAKYVRIQTQHRHAPMITVPARHRLAKMWDELDGMRKDYEANVATKRTHIIGALESVTTVKRLIEVWPEIEPFARPFLPDENAAPRLPSVPTETLNAELGLPVGDK